MAHPNGLIHLLTEIVKQLDINFQRWTWTQGDATQTRLRLAIAINSILISISIQFQFFQLQFWRWTWTQGDATQTRLMLAIALVGWLECSLQSGSKKWVQTRLRQFLWFVPLIFSSGSFRQGSPQRLWRSMQATTSKVLCGATNYMSFFPFL